MQNITHADLVKAAEKYLYNTLHCGVVFTEFAPYGEIPDAIGFKQSYTIMIECKVSKADFLADRRKKWRLLEIPKVINGLGDYRFYLCPVGLINPDELPTSWGLLYFNNNKIRRIIGPQGNVWGLKYRFIDKDYEAEYRLMYSALRRIKLRGALSMIYDKIESMPPDNYE